jgi:hypothetical protein
MDLRARLQIMIIAAALLAPAVARGEVSEDSVKSAFLPRFARYVEWPGAARPTGSAPFVLCIIGGDPFGNQLDQAVASQSIDGHGLVVRRLSSAAGAGACHIAYVEGNRTQSAGQLLAALAADPVLTVTDARSGSQRGMIHFVIIDGRVRFFIDEAAAARRGLTISSRLLALAAGVKQR